MIIDELIAVLFSFVGLLLEALSGFFVLIFNGFAYLIEFVMLLFVSDFSLGRAKKYKRNKNQNTSEYNHQNIQNSRTGHFEKLMPLMVIVFVVGYFVISSYLKRYKTTTWQTNEIDDILTVKRSLLGKGVNKLAEKLLMKIKGD